MGASMSTMYYYPVSSSRAAKILMKVLRLHPCASVFISGLRILVRGGRAALWGRLQHKRRGPSLGSETHAVGLCKMVAQASACEPAQNQQLRPWVSPKPVKPERGLKLPLQAKACSTKPLDGMLRRFAVSIKLSPPALMLRIHRGVSPRIAPTAYIDPGA